MQNDNNGGQPYSSSRFYETIQNPTANVSNKVFIQPNSIDRTLLANYDDRVQRNFENFQINTQGEDRKKLYGNPLTIGENLESYWANFTDTASWEVIRRGFDYFDDLQREYKVVKPEDIIYQQDIENDERFKSLGLQIPKTGWTPAQFERMVKYSQSVQTMDELNRVKSGTSTAVEFAVNIIPYLNPYALYTGTAAFLVSDPFMAPLGFLGVAGSTLAKTKAGKVAVMGGLGAVEGGVAMAILDEITEKRRYEATGKTLTTEEKINNMLWGAAMSAGQFAAFQGITSGVERFQKSDTAKRLQNTVNQVKSVFTNDKTSTLARESAIADLKRQGIANPEAILPEDKATLTAKFDAMQDIKSGSNQIMKGYDLDMGAVRDAERDPAFLKSNEAINTNTRGFDIFPTAYVSDNKIFRVDYEIVEKSTLTPSHDYLGNEIPHYPKTYQPRDRSTYASIDQMNKIAQNPNPNKLIPSLDFFQGSPIVDIDGNVIIGNGRTIGLSRAYDIGTAEGYRQKLAEAFPHLAPENFDNPVLVRRFKPETKAEDIEYISRLSNDEDKLNYNIVETAKLDAENLVNSGAISLYKKRGIETDANREFFSSFLSSIPTNQKQNFLQKDGSLSQIGKTRIEASLIQYAYGNDNLTRFLYETQDDLSQTIVNAVKDIAPDIINVKNLINGGLLDANLDISPHIANAFEIYSITKRSGIGMDIPLNTGNLYGNNMPEMTEAVLRTFFKDELNGKGIMPKGKLNDIFETLMERIQNTKTTGDNAFDFASEPYNPVKMLEDVKKTFKPDYLPIKQRDYTLNKQEYNENPSIAHEEVVKSLKNEDEQKAYKKTLEDDAEMEQYIKCNNYQ